MFVFDEAKARTYYLKSPLYHAYQTDTEIVIPIADGTLRARPGDWIVKDNFWGRCHVVSSWAFERQYQLASQKEWSE